MTEMIASAMGKGKEMEEIFPMPGGIMNLFAKMTPLHTIFCLLRAGMALMATGISQAALEASIKYAKERVQFGKPIGKFQLVQEMLYKIASITETSRLLSYHAFDLVVKGNPDARKMSSLAKCYACEGSVWTTYCAMQIHGAMGLSQELPLERYFRDARMMTIPDGTTEMQKLIVGYEILGKGFSACT